MKPTLAFVAVTAALLAAQLVPYGTGALPGTVGTMGQVPLDVTRDLSPTNASCGQCHRAFPGGGVTPLHVSVAPQRRALRPGESISITTSSTGGQVTMPPLMDLGGFCTDATAGTFTAGSNSQVNGAGTAVSHLRASMSNGRSWTYGYQAPTQPGLVEVYTVVNTVDGDGRAGGGDFWGFHGFNAASARSTPVRLYVLAPGVEPAGDGCPDAWGNYSVLGAQQTPAVGNSGFALELHGAVPANLAFLLLGFNPPNFLPVDLGAFGITGCFAHVHNPVTNVAVTTPGDLMLAEGTALWPLPIPSNPALQGLSVNAQSIYIDPFARTIGRTLGMAVSNGVKITVQ